MVQISFVAGAALLAHAFYAAFGMQEELQAHHHSASGGIASIMSSSHALSQSVPLLRVNSANSSSTAASLPIWIVIEVLVGFVLAVFGYLAQSVKLHKIRLSDHQSETRYEQAVFTGMEFSHFNHRGAVISDASSRK